MKSAKTVFVCRECGCTNFKWLGKCPDCGAWNSFDEEIIKDNKKTVIMITHDVAEAVTVADRVVVLTDRPACIKKIFEIKMEEKSSPINNRKCKEFSEYYDMIWKAIDFHV